MSNRGDVYSLFAVENRINYSIVANADAPQVLFASQLAGTMWTWACGKGFYLGKDAANDRRVENLKLVPS
jgi:hypothetical protein